MDGWMKDLGREGQWMEVDDGWMNGERETKNKD